MQVPGFNVPHHKIKEHDANHRPFGFPKLPKEAPVGESFSKSDETFALSDPKFYPGLKRAAADMQVKVNPHVVAQNALEAGIRLTSRSLLGIPGAVLNVVTQDQKTIATLTQNGETRELPVHKTFEGSTYSIDNLARVELPGMKSVTFYTGGSTDSVQVTVHKQGEQTGLQASYSDVGGAKQRLRSIAAFTGGGWSNLVRMNFDAEGKASNVVVGSNERLGQDSIHKGTNSAGTYATVRNRNESMSVGLFGDPSAQEMFGVAENVMRGLNRLRAQ